MFLLANVYTCIFMSHLICMTLDDQLLEVKYAFNLETLILYVGTSILQITQIFRHLKLWVTVAKNSFK